MLHIAQWDGKIPPGALAVIVNADGSADCYLQGDVVPPQPGVVVYSATARQLRLAMTRGNLRTLTENHVGAQPQDFKDWWSFSPCFTHNEPNIQQIATALGKTPAQVIALFQLASTL